MDKERFSGCLIGQCLGDALGFPVEGFSPEFCAQALRGDARSGLERQLFPFGQYTDDSQLARELLQSYAACASILRTLRGGSPRPTMRLP